MPPSEKHWFVIREGNIRILPVIHERVEFADAVRLALESERPPPSRWSLPSSLQEYAERAALRLPKMSVMLYESPERQPNLLDRVPGRSARGRGPVGAREQRSGALRRRGYRRPGHAVARGGPGYPRSDGPRPMKRSIERSSKGARFRTPTPRTGSGKKGMAFRLKQIAGKHEGTVLFICGMAHAERIREDLQTPLTEPMDRRERTAVHVFHLHPDSMQEVLWDPPYVQALYEMRRKGLPEEPERP